MQTGNLEMDWGFDYYESECFVENPVSYMYEFKIFEDDLSSDFQSSFTFVNTNADVKLEDLSTGNTLSNIFATSQVPEISSNSNSEPCAAALAIAANIPAPKPRTLHQWRTFINSAYYHPNIMAHFDVNCLKELFQLFGSNISFGSVNVMIHLGKGHKEPVYNLRPKLSPHQKPPLFTFAQIKEFSIDLELQVCVVKNYSIIESMKTAVNEMVNFIIEFPEALYLETYGFVLDFLLKFRVRSEVIIDAVMRTQRRRRRSQKPASVLVLKQASKLGKGRKEFLQRRLMFSPEKTYDPVVPIITEPISVRHLRNRSKSAAIEGLNSLTSPNDLVDCKLNLTADDTITLQDKKPINGNIRTATRKLFADAEKAKSYQTVIKNEIEIPSIAETATVSKLAANGVTREEKRKKIYIRRDESLIEKPFVCTICPDKRSFAYKGNLVIHMKHKHMDEANKPPVRKHRPKPDGYVPPYTCPACLRGYASKLICKTHIQQFHTDRGDWEPLRNTVAHSNFKPFKRSRLAKNTTSKVSSKNKRPKVGKVSTKTETSSQLINKNQTYGSVYPLPPTPTQDFPVDIRLETGINVQMDSMQFDTIQSVINRQFGTAVK